MVVYIRNIPRNKGSNLTTRQILKLHSYGHELFTSCEKCTDQFTFMLGAYEAQAYIYKEEFSQYSVNCPDYFFAFDGRPEGRKLMEDLLRKMGFEVIPKIVVPDQRPNNSFRATANQIFSLFKSVL